MNRDSLMCKNCDFTKAVLPFIIGLILTLVVTNVLKHTLKVERPSTYKGGRDRYSFPSGHSSTVTFIFLYIFLVSPSILTLILLIFMWYRVAYGSYTEGYHRFSEVIAGSIIGGVIAIYIVNRSIKE
jgi:membrane-associated phospholipid phosphatase